MAEIAASGQLAEKTRALLGDLWERSLPMVKARIDLLDQAAESIPLPEALRIEAMNIAHKLAGSLGMFGFAEGTRISRQLELALDVPAPDSSQLVLLTRQLREQVFPAPPTAP
jgi:HPt (histidine-containing phosphotransfer) domain-containing protein